MLIISIKMSTNNNNISFCDSKTKIINSLNALEDLRKIMISDNRIARTVIEETIVIKHGDIKKMIVKLDKMLPYLKTTLVWNIKELKDLIIFVENNLNFVNISPGGFSEFMEILLKRKQTEKNIRFLKYIINDNVKCKQIFTNYKI
jgi:hypothetical protein